ncbi:O-methyltransferase [Ceratobasidium theobromae]|uniref:O-methyltransferase n=1 Tax=Ceratobasidium theobromae TaxID=1582974 RepID=A0A5N5QNA9_9AGAM|nr:O-methyltransferase [Ceratobasidium theobromae]
MDASDLWIQSDAYHNKHLLKDDSILEQTLHDSTAGGLMPISVSRAQGKYLNLQVRALGVKRILEVGTLGGYSAICMARALPEDGKLITLEINPHNAEVARENIERAGLSDRVEIKIGPAAETLPTLGPDHSFDFAFIDADKMNNHIYFQHAQRLVKAGGIVIVDNVVRNGRVADESIKDEDDPNIKGTRLLLRHVQSDSTVEATTIATVGDKGYDGFMFAMVNIGGSN